MKRLALCLLVVSCSSPPGFEPPRRIYVEAQELEAPADQALERWTVATGVAWHRVDSPSEADLTVVRSELPDGKQGQHNSHMVIVAPGLEGEALDRVLAHEFGHALGAEHIQVPGVMQPTLDHMSRCITAADLRTACTEFACTNYEPECLASEVTE